MDAVCVVNEQQHEDENNSQIVPGRPMSLLMLPSVGDRGLGGIVSSLNTEARVGVTKGIAQGEVDDGWVLGGASMDQHSCCQEIFRLATLSPVGTLNVFSALIDMLFTPYRLWKSRKVCILLSNNSPGDSRDVPYSRIVAKMGQKAE